MVRRAVCLVTLAATAQGVGWWLYFSPPLDATALPQRAGQNAGPQNASRTGDWDLGQRFRGQDEPVVMYVYNGCRIGQSVSVEYPKTMPLKGPATLDLDAWENKPLKMTLALAMPPVKPPPYPPGTVFNCHPVKDTLKLKHEEAKEVTRVAGGTEVYTCFGTQETRNISMFLHEHGSPDPPDAGGGRGRGPKKKPGPNSTCSLYWNHAEFFPSPSQQQPDQCRSEILPMAQEFFGPALDPLRKIRPSDFEFAPKPAELDKMPLRDLMEMKWKVDDAARAKK
jgi:hypothetical protein